MKQVLRSLVAVTLLAGTSYGQPGVQIGDLSLSCWPSDAYRFVEVSLSPPGDALTAKLYLRAEDQADFHFVEMTVDRAGIGRAIVPMAESQTRNVVYFAELVTHSYTATRTEPKRAPVMSREDCETREPEADWYAGTNPDIALGSTRPGSSMAMGFRPDGISRFVGVGGTVESGGGGSKLPLILAGTGGAIGAGVFALSSGSDGNTGGNVGGPTLPPVGGGSTSISVPTTTAPSGGGGPTGTTTTVAPGGNPTTVPGVPTTTAPGTTTASGTTTIPSGTTTGPSTTTVVGSTTTSLTTSVPTTTSLTTSVPTTTSLTTSVPTTSVPTTTSPTTSVPTTTSPTTSPTTSVPTTTSPTTSVPTTTSVASTTSVATTTSVASVQLRISKTDDTDPVPPNTRFNYFLTVNNISAANATGVRVEDPLPSGIVVEFIDSASCRLFGSTLQCINLSIAAGSSVTFRVQVRSPSSPGQITNTATVFWSGGSHSATQRTNVSTLRAPESGSARTLFRTFLDFEPYDGRVQGRILLNDSAALQIDNSGPVDHPIQVLPGENSVEANLGGASGRGLWRFDFGASRRFVPGSLRVDSGQVFSIDATSVVFSVSPGTIVRFRFQGDASER